MFDRNVPFLDLHPSVCSMFRFERFLVVKLAERTQELSRLRCRGCIEGYLLDQLHDCMKVPLKEKINIFIHRAKDEALTKINNLFHIYQQSAWVDDEQMVIEAGKTFIANLTANGLMDRRYVNEDTVMEYPYNTSWVADEDDFLAAQVEQNVSPIDTVKAPQKKRKKKD